MRMRKATVALVGLLLAGVAATPAHAETIRSQQWHLDAMKADEIWKITNGRGITVAVIDTGVNQIPELEGQVLPGKAFPVTDAEVGRDNDYLGHGTSMAAMIGATGKHPSGDGSYGLAPGVKILPIRVPDQFEDAATPNLVAAIRFAADSEAKVINISQGLTGKPEDDRARAEAVKYALSKGKLIFAAAGNTGDATNRIEYPAATPGVVGVAAVDANGEPTKESQHGPQIDMAAPGIDIVSACKGKTGLCKTHGTSDASALAAASAALLWSAHPDWTNNQVLRVLLNNAGKPVDGSQRNDFVGYGVVRPRVALQTPGDPGPADVYPLPDLAASQAGAKSPSAAASAAPSPAPQAAEAAKGGSSLLWVGLGLGACVLIGGAVTAVVVRRNR
ncbi:type VII secretion-associated serine protease mycosin [Streptomyces sp. MMS21 TC-5]|uniref:type VII secretion-associated serine protease mycosin n=1 Tax=unclassified Streptomyces TaxID=2593676 RepID=UPI001F607D14|nr:type VII secretion-associated serine protease mycosin [Streptomyces sp. MMS21 TC-5]MCI4081767.1 type VII secretion-associated serine protease mycosin [Streptomyces sp. MMS21 TC-5]